jgi:hypothetical protein
MAYHTFIIFLPEDRMKTTTQPGRKGAAPRQQTAAESPRAVVAREPQAPEPSESERPTTTPLAEHNAGHALERTLEALSVDHQTAERMQQLPQDIGWLLVAAGVVGVVMPGVLGVPFLALGGLILMPATNRRAERWLTGHSPRIFKGSVRQINRFLDDLEKRYPRARTKDSLLLRHYPRGGRE